MPIELSRHLDSSPFEMEIEKKDFWEQIAADEIDTIKTRPRERRH